MKRMIVCTEQLSEWQICQLFLIARYEMFFKELLFRATTPASSATPTSRTPSTPPATASAAAAAWSPPTYTQLENAAMSSFNKPHPAANHPGNAAANAASSFSAAIYNPSVNPYSLKMDQDTIYTVKGQR